MPKVKEVNVKALVAEKPHSPIKKTKPGIYNDLSNQAYHADPAIGSSGLRDFIKLPALYHWNYISPDNPGRVSTPAQEMGSAAHTVVLEPEKFDELYMVAPEEARDRRSKAWTETYNQAFDAGKTPILFKEYQKLMEMVEAFRSHPLATKMVVGGVAEQSHFAKDPTTGIIMKARPDYLIAGEYMIDYKTTGIDLGVTNFSRHEFNMERHIQAAHHKAVVELTTGQKIKEVLHIAQMQKPPYFIRIFRIPEDWLEFGEDTRRTGLDNFAHCLKNKDFPAYPVNEIEDLILPNWAYHQFNG
nr:hypothetical protein 41 [bacterium]